MPSSARSDSRASGSGPKRSRSIPFGTTWRRSSGHSRSARATSAVGSDTATNAPTSRPAARRMASRRGVSGLTPRLVWTSAAPAARAGSAENRSGCGLWVCTTSAPRRWNRRPSSTKRRTSRPGRLGTVAISRPWSRNSAASGPSGGGASDTVSTLCPSAACPVARSSATRSWPPIPKDDSTCTIDRVMAHPPDGSSLALERLLPDAAQHDERRAGQDAQLHREERAELLERGQVGQVVEQLDAHVVGQRAVRLRQLEGVLQRAGQLRDLAALLDAPGVAERDLRQAGDARLDVAHALLEERDGVRQVLEQLRTLRPRADQAHRAAQDVEQLRELVEPRLAEEAADPGDARVVLLGQDRAGVLLGVRLHGPELVHVELVELNAPHTVVGAGPHQLAGALLAEQDRAGRVDVDRGRDDRDDRRGHREAECGADDIDGALCDPDGQAHAGVTLRSPP